MISECQISSKSFGLTPDGQEVLLFTLEVPGVIKASIMNLGATLVSLFTPDRNGQMGDIVLGFDSLAGYFQEDYQQEYCYIGATIGRVAGRTNHNQFILDGKIHHLPINQGDTHLHGGVSGWDRKLWEAEVFEEENEIGVLFKLMSSNSEEGYPGNLTVSVRYSINENAELKISYEAITDQATIINPTNHSYFNLSGDLSRDILDHRLTIYADRFLPINAEGFPEGLLKEVDDSPFDLRNGEQLGAVLADNHLQLIFGHGIDHSFELKPSGINAEVYHPKSGRKMTCTTTAPAVQVYTSNYLSGAFKGKGGVAFRRHAAICLETQGFPNAANREDLPSIRLNPGELFQSETIFKFTFE